MKLSEPQRALLISKMMTIVSSLPYRGFSRYWKELAEVDTIRVALGMSFEEVSRVLAKKGLKLSIMSQTRISNGRDTHDGKPCPALQRELAKARSKTWVEPDVEHSRPSSLKLSASTTLADIIREVERMSPPAIQPAAQVVVKEAVQALERSEQSRTKGIQQTLPLAKAPVANEGVVSPRPKNADDGKLMMIDDVAKLLGTSVQQTRNMVGRGQLVKPIKVPGLGLRWRASDVNNWIQGLGQ